MKKTILFMTLVCAGCLINPPKVSAGGEWEAVAGFVGGMLFKSAIDNNHHHRVYTHSSSVHVGASVSIGGHGHCGGYWKTITEREWVSGTWTYHYDECGRQYKTWRAGYYRCYTRRVWVSY
jgi:hypothetical protein